MRRVFTALIVTTCLTALLFTATALAGASLPTRGAFFGAYVMPRGGLSFYAAERSFEKSLGRKLAIVNQYHGWSDTHYKDEARFIATGQLVMISWHPTDGAGDPTMASKVASGRYDSLIRTAANNMKALKGPVLLRWDFEMTQPPGQREYIGTPANFIAAWRHMHKIFVAQGATNVQWVWAPQSSGFTDGTAPSYYPGSAYVDWIEASDVMGGHTWPTFAKLFTPMYRWAAPTGKPLLVWVGVPEHPLYRFRLFKARWLTGMRDTIETSMPAVKGALYFDAKKSSGNWLANTTPQAWTAFRSMALDPYYRALP
jgi:hypothetical protein